MLDDIVFHDFLCPFKQSTTGWSKKKRTGDFLQNSQNISPMNLKISMHNLNTYSFQHLKYEFPNVKAL